MTPQVSSDSLKSVVSNLWWLISAIIEEGINFPVHFFLTLFLQRVYILVYTFVTGTWSGKGIHYSSNKVHFLEGYSVREYTNFSGINFLKGVHYSCSRGHTLC